MAELLPLFVNLAGRRVVLVGGGPVAAAKLAVLTEAGADVLVVAPAVCADIEGAGVPIARRPFEPSDLDGAWLVIAAATPEVNRSVSEAAEPRRVFVNAVDDPSNASAFLSGVVRRAGVTLAISTSGGAPGLTALLRQALDAVLPRELGDWLHEARRQRVAWRRERVPMADRRPLLLRALNRLYESGGHEGARVPGAAAAQEPRAGHVSLVGAGPGDPALLTRAAVARLRAADLVLYDAMVDSRVIRLAPLAQRFFVGKRAGRHSIAQQDIHTVMIRAARRGRRVVRLKGGDPFVFGRGGEEASALLKAGVSFDVVPGVTSAVAAPALAGIPITYRGVASAVLILSGHDVRAFAEALDHVGPHDLTLVVLMGLSNRALLGAALLDRGWSPLTSVAVVAAASLPYQEVWRGTLIDLASAREVTGGAGPATIVIGQVAALELASVASATCAVNQESVPAIPNSTGR